jgi:hypothetical protein
MRCLAVLLLVAAACGSSTPAGGDSTPGETAAERARREHAEANEGEVAADGKSWGGWRYKGSRDECFYVVGRTCFTDERSACEAAGCKQGKCRTTGGGPATVSCAAK